MAYARLNKTGCHVRKGNVQLRLDFYLESGDPRYDDLYLYLVDVTSTEYLEGYPGKVDEFENPIDQADYDKWWDALPRIWENTPFHSHFAYFGADVTQEDIKAQMEFHSPNFYKAFQERKDEVNGGMRHGWATEKRIKPTDYSKTDTTAEYDIRVAECQAVIDSLTEFSFKPVGEVEGQEFPATEIDIGPGATDRASSRTTRTHIDLGNPANDTGIIDTFEVWAYATMDGTNKVGTFYGAGTDYTNRDGESIGTVTAGAKRTFTGLTIDVTSGDFAGMYFQLGSIERDYEGQVGSYGIANDQFGTGEQTYTLQTGDAVSLYATGETAGAVDYPISTTSNLSLASSLARSFAFDRGTSPNLSLTATLSRIYGRICTMSSNLSLAPSVSRALAIGRDISANLSLSITGPELYEYYNTGDNGNICPGGTKWIAQTFTPSTSHEITKVKLKLWRNGSPGTVTVSIKATDGNGHPTGDDLCYNTFDGDTLPTTEETAEWYEITLGSGYSLSADTKYAIVVRAPSGGTGNEVEWRQKIGSSTYGGGCEEYSADSGSNWTSYTGNDNMFEEWGDSSDISRVVTFARATTSNLSLTASLSKLRGWVISTASNLNLATTISRAVMWTQAISSNLSLATNVARSWSRTIATSANLSLTTALDRVLASIRTTSSDLTAAVSIARSRNRTYSISVGLSAFLTIINRLANEILISCGLVVSTSATVLKGFVRTLTANATVATAISTSRGWTETLAANLNLTAAISRVVTFAKATSTALTGISSFSAVWSGVTDTLVTIGTSLTVAASVAYQWAAKRTVSPGLTLTAAISRAVTKTRSVAVSLTAAVSFLINEAVGRALKVITTVSHVLSIKTVASHVHKIITKEGD